MVAAAWWETRGCIAECRNAASRFESGQRPTEYDAHMGVGPDARGEPPGGQEGEMRRCLGCGVLVTRGSRCARCAAQRSTRRTRERAGTGWRWQEMRRAIIDRDGGCVMVGEHAGPLRVDHIVPLADGGTSEPTNLQVLCYAHHRAKTPNGGG